MSELETSTGFFKACLEYLVLGAVQGLTEFLPISSTAHLKVVPMVLGWGDPGVSISAVLQLGSIFAVIAYFKKDLRNVLKGITLAIRYDKWNSHDAQLGMAICIGTLPIILVGMLIKIVWPGYSNSMVRSLPFIAITSIVMAILLAIAEEFGSRKKELDQIKLNDGFSIGIAQTLAFIPGVSRSGITLTAALLNGCKRDSAARFSFLMGIPAITLTGVIELRNSFISPEPKDIVPIIIGVISSALVSWLSIAWLLNFFQKNNSWIFIAYRLFFGVFILSWWIGTP